MQTIIMCGGKGTRLREMTEFIPKPLIPIGQQPILWHIMKHYGTYGYNNFILALGYKQELFKDYFLHYKYRNNDLYLNTNLNTIETTPSKENWNVRLIDTGINTLKLGRLLKVKKYIQDNIFMLTYGDAVSDIDLNKLVRFHKEQGKIITITGVPPKPRFGEIIHSDGEAKAYNEKQPTGTLVNGGFMVINTIEFFDFLEKEIWEHRVFNDLETTVFPILTEQKKLAIYEHTGFWQCMDTINDMEELKKLWDTCQPPWKVWGSYDE